MVDPEKIAEAIKFKDITDHLKQKYYNNVTDLFIHYHFANEEEYFDTLWHFRKDSSIIWIKIIDFSPFEWSIGDFWKFRAYLNWDHISHVLMLGHFSDFGIGIIKFLDTFKNYVNWKIIKSLSERQYTSELKKRFKDYWK